MPSGAARLVRLAPASRWGGRAATVLPVPETASLRGSTRGMRRRDLPRRLSVGMEVLSVNVGVPQTIMWGDREIRTAFRKVPVNGKIEFRGVNLLGDDQADRSVHGGERKSVYVYPVEHYPWWRQELELTELPWGSFGENLTTSGWLESDACVGDRVRIGTAEFVVASPRKPCYKLEASFRRNDMIRRFHRSRRSGFYLAGRRPGTLTAGDRIELLSRQAGSPTIADTYPRYAEEAGIPPD